MTCRAVPVVEDLNDDDIITIDEESPKKPLAAPPPAAVKLEAPVSALAAVKLEAPTVKPEPGFPAQSIKRDPGGAVAPDAMEGIKAEHPAHANAALLAGTGIKTEAGAPPSVVKTELAATARPRRIRRATRVAECEPSLPLVPAPLRGTPPSAAASPRLQSGRAADPPGLLPNQAPSVASELAALEQGTQAAALAPPASGPRNGSILDRARALEAMGARQRVLNLEREVAAAKAELEAARAHWLGAAAVEVIHSSLQSCGLRSACCSGELRSWVGRLRRRRWGGRGSDNEC